MQVETSKKVLLVHGNKPSQIVKVTLASSHKTGLTIPLLECNAWGTAHLNLVCQYLCPAGSAGRRTQIEAGEYVLPICNIARTSILHCAFVMSI